MTDRERANDVRRDRGRGHDRSSFVADGFSSSEAEFAADLSAVQADDALLDALGGSDPKVADGLGDQELNALLLAWRRDIDSEPLAELVDTDTAVATVKTAALARKHAGTGRKRRFMVPVAAAAAVLAIAFTGTGLAARDAQPGDTLWGLTKVLYADHARSIEAAATVRSDLEAANVALLQGRYDDARKALDAAQAALKQVSTEDNLAQLMLKHQELSAMLRQNPGGQPPVPSKPNTPPPGSQPGTAPSTSNPQPGTPPENTGLPPLTSSNKPTPPSSDTSPPPPSTSTPPTSSSSPPAPPGGGTGGEQPRSDPPAGAPEGAAQVPPG